ncbi:MAG: hypothetical protein A2086_10205 [Spirochaetes bacterium GWD1_27_9]|nr:MAG: hypothetical protein A2Z98_11760 [Spirochaetes bacterium GWB1_27_13]OHD35869.1 MAG: hypothetical protein A2086_10205 [Spirochaetes bacterium GWD1_27_9]
MKNIIFVSIILLFLISCATKQAVREPDSITQATVFKEEEQTPVVYKRTGFRYDIPNDMEETSEANTYRYDNLLVEKGCNVFDSPIVIAIRKTNDFSIYSLGTFAENDQKIMKSSVKNVYYDAKWDAPGLSEKGIEYLSYQFSYDYGKQTIYQRSVYIRYFDTFYIISLSSKYKASLLNSKNDFFWNSICVD